MPRLFTLALLAVALVLGGVLAFRTSFAPLGGEAVPTRPVVPDERLVDDRGQARRLSDLSGTKLVFFGFTRCPDVCPATLGVLARALEAQPRSTRERLQVVLVTVDPETDTPAQLRAYLSKFSPEFVGLTGSAEALERMRRGFYIFAAKGADEQVVHGDTVAVVDAQGRMRRVYGQEAVTGGVLTRDLGRLAAGRF